MVTADRTLTGAQFQFSRTTTDARRAWLSRQLRGGDRPTALGYLATFSEDAYELLPDLLWLGLSHAWAGEVRNAIGRIPKAKLLPGLAELLPPLLDEADGDQDGYDDYATLLESVAAWYLLHVLCRRAEANPDPDVRDVGGSFAERYGALWQGK
ncbi:MAG TPA: hypothetical protein VGM75_19585 [Pseudonocardiaceae bacterium]